MHDERSRIVGRYGSPKRFVELWSRSLQRYLVTEWDKFQQLYLVHIDIMFGLDQKKKS